MGEREDVLWQLHPVVTGVERAGDTARCTINRQEVPPRKALTGADVVLCSLIVFIFYQYRCHTYLPPLNKVAAPNLKHPASIDLAVPSLLQLMYRILIVILYQTVHRAFVVVHTDAGADAFPHFALNTPPSFHSRRWPTMWTPSL